MDKSWKTYGKRLLTWPILIVAIMISISFTESKIDYKTCNQILVDIDEQESNYFITEDDIIDMLTRNGEQFILGTRFEELNLKELETRVRAHPFVHRADVYRDLKGNLMVDVIQCRPLIRILYSEGDKYLSRNKELLPLSSRFTSRVPVVFGKVDKWMVKEFWSEDEGVRFFRFINHISENPFWKAQLAGIEVLDNGYFNLHPQVGKQIIEFGNLENFEEKLNKLSVFYDQILPRKGWNHYDRVNVAYRDQIICE
jgi:cell division protein FtsQ